MLLWELNLCGNTYCYCNYGEPYKLTSHEFPRLISRVCPGVDALAPWRRLILLDRRGTRTTLHRILVGCLPGSVRGACESWSWSHEFEPHTGCRDDLSKQNLYIQKKKKNLKQVTSSCIWVFSFIKWDYFHIGYCAIGKEFPNPSRGEVQERSSLVIPLNQRPAIS